MRWWLAFVVLVLLAGEARADLKPHQREAGERIQKLFRHQPPAPVAPPVVRVEPTPKIEPAPKMVVRHEPRVELRQKSPKPRPAKPRVVVTPSYCGQIALGVRFFGVGGMVQKARERGYSSSQIASAMRACGYS